MTWITSAIHTTSKGCSLCLHQYPRRVHLYQWGCISLLLFASPPRAFSFKSPSWWRGLPQRSIPHPKDVLFACTSTPEEFISTSGAASLFSSLHLLGCSLCLHQCPRRVHLYQWGCISLLLFASPPRAFSFKSPSWWRGLPQRSIPRPKDVLFACTSTPEEFISTSGAASLFSSLHLLRMHSLLNPQPDDVDYLSDPSGWGFKRECTRRRCKEEKRDAAPLVEMNSSGVLVQAKRTSFGLLWYGSLR